MVTQAQLGERMRANRSDVAEFEGDNGGAEFGLALQATRAAKPALTVESEDGILCHQHGEAST
jgi:hypothetical protein